LEFPGVNSLLDLPWNPDFPELLFFGQDAPGPDFPSFADFHQEANRPAPGRQGTNVRPGSKLGPFINDHPVPFLFVNGRGVGWIKSLESFLGSLRLLAEALIGAVEGFFV
jgi:hypothetical protein